MLQDTRIELLTLPDQGVQGYIHNNNGRITFTYRNTDIPNYRDSKNLKKLSSYYLMVGLVERHLSDCEGDEADAHEDGAEQHSRV